MDDIKILGGKAAVEISSAELDQRIEKLEAKIAKLQEILTSLQDVKTSLEG